MSNVNIRRVIENIRSGTNIYTPVVELIVNAIQAIDEKNVPNGLVEVQIIRSPQEELLEGMRSVDGFIVSDNGVGFTQCNRDSFDTLYTEQKQADGGKGFGRFTCLKYFDRLDVTSVFDEDGCFHERKFVMGLERDIIIDEKVEPTEKCDTGSAVRISGIKGTKFPDKGIDIISRVIVERLLPYFMDNDRPCPRVIIKDANSASPILLNDYVRKDNSQIIEIPNLGNTFTLGPSGKTQVFVVRIFKFYSPRTARSKVSLVAHRREVTEVVLQNYVPEFSEEFCEPETAPEGFKNRNFVIKAYVFGDYLNDNVSLERGEFRFEAESDLLNGISQTQIEERAAELAQSVVGAEIIERQQRKQDRINDYVTSQAPWHRKLSGETDFSTLPMRPSNQEIELYLQRKKFDREAETRIKVAEILSAGKESDLDIKISEVMASISETSKNDLIHYVSMRKCVLDLFGKALEIGADGQHKSEGEVHDIIMQRKKDSDELDFDSHNLWILDERLNFAEYVASEKPINKRNGNRTDITVFNRRVAFRGENEAGNPITIFEFKKPQRKDFANPSSSDDPIAQIVRYVNQIRDGKYKTPKGRDIIINENTPFYGYVVCDISNKTAEWLNRDKNFTPMPDGLGWFQWYGNIKLYIEVISWTKLLRDAEMRNKIFFRALGID